MTRPERLDHTCHYDDYVVKAIQPLLRAEYSYYTDSTNTHILSSAREVLLLVKREQTAERSESYHSPSVSLY